MRQGPSPGTVLRVSGVVPPLKQPKISVSSIISRCTMYKYCFGPLGVKVLFNQFVHVRNKDVDHWKNKRKATSRWRALEVDMGFAPHSERREDACSQQTRYHRAPRISISFCTTKIEGGDNKGGEQRGRAKGDNMGGGEQGETTRGERPRGDIIDHLE
jgi:hypothetical protein